MRNLRQDFIRKGVLAFLSVVLLWLAFPGNGHWWLVFIALLPLFSAADSLCIKQAALAGFLFGVIHNFFTLYWLITVLQKYGGLPLLLAVGVLLLLAVYMAFYPALFFLCFSLFRRKLAAPLLLLVLPLCWVGLDWLRAVLFTGFPWMDLGYVVFKSRYLVQLADLFGHYGITFLIVFVNCFFYVLYRELAASGRGKGRRLLVSFLLAGIVIGGAAMYSGVRFHQFAAGGRGNEQKIRVGIVQGNIDQAQKWSPDNQGNTVQKYLHLTSSLLSGNDVGFVVWPETAMPFYPTVSEITNELLRFSQQKNVGIMTGAPWVNIINRQKRKYQFFNSAFIVNSDGTLGERYFKSHLVPFGEYVPLKEYLPFLAPVVESVGSFTPGTVEKPLVINKAKIGTLICFESVFPEISRQWMLKGANILVSLTNDAWYGKSSAPFHSLAMSVLRAVENRRSLVRSANTGVSAFVLADGSIADAADIFVDWAKTETVSLRNDVTFWVKWGYLFAPLSLIFTGLSVLGCMSGRNRKS